LLRDYDVHNTPPVMSEHQQHEQQPARRRWYDEEIGGHDLLNVIG
jgi:hypothetical protein